MAVKITSRDQEILDLLREGCANKEIAERLHISDRTVKQHIRIMGYRLGLHGGVHLRLKLLNALDQREPNEFKLFRMPKRDAAIIRAICQGKGNREIGQELGKSEQCTKNLVRFLYDKVGASSRLEVLQMFT